MQVVLAGRGEDRLGVAASQVLERVPGAQVDQVELDLSSLRRIRIAAAELASRYSSIDVLVNNAGVMYTPLQRTADGFEMQFGVNHLGHFEWTKRLAPLLLAGRGGRVVSVASDGHRANDINLADPNWTQTPYDKFAAYAASKTANILFAVGLERRLGHRGVHAFAVHPGTVNTTLGRHMTREDVTRLKEMVAVHAGAANDAPPRINYDSLADGVATTVWAATSGELAGRGGLYLARCEVAEAAAYASNPRRAQQLWSLSEALCGSWEQP